LEDRLRQILAVVLVAQAWQAVGLEAGDSIFVVVADSPYLLGHIQEEAPGLHSIQFQTVHMKNLVRSGYLLS
jgi:hypothetical protein